MRKQEILTHIENAKMVEERVKPLYILEDYLHDEQGYIDFKESIYDLIKGGFEHKDVREYPIKFKFYRKSRKVFVLELRHFVLELFILYPMVFIKDLTDVLDESFVPDFREDIPYINDYINYKLIDTMRNHDVKNTIMNRAISCVTYDLKRISMDLSLIIGMNFSTEMFIDLYNNHEEIREIMESSFPVGAQPNEIEDIMSEKLKRLMSLIKQVPNNNLAVVLRSKTGIKDKQLGEYMIAQAQKPDIEGKLITIPIENSTLIGGTNRPSYHYIDASAARKSLIMNKKVMGKAGYYGKKVLLLSMTLSLSRTVFDCGTKHMVPYKVWGEKVLQKLNDRYYRLENDPSEELKLLNAKKDKHLIGKTIWVRSVVTCALGDEVCQCCVGRTAKLNMDIAKGFAGFESEEITRRNFGDLKPF